MTGKQNEPYSGHIFVFLGQTFAKIASSAKVGNSWFYFWGAQAHHPTNSVEITKIIALHCGVMFGNAHMIRCAHTAYIASIS